MVDLFAYHDVERNALFFRSFSDMTGVTARVKYRGELISREEDFEKMLPNIWKYVPRVPLATGDVEIEFEHSGVIHNKELLKFVSFQRPDPSDIYRVCKYLPGVRTMVEVGSYQGDSTVQFCKALGCRVFAVDPWKNFYDATDSSSERYDMTNVEHNFDVHVEHFEVVKMKMDSEEGSKCFEDETLDFVYIDGNHTYEHVIADVRNWLPKVKEGGVIGGHDYTYPSVRRAVDRHFEPDIVVNSSWLKRKKYSNNLLKKRILL